MSPSPPSSAFLEEPLLQGGEFPDALDVEPPHRARSSLIGSEDDQEEEKKTDELLVAASSLDDSAARDGGSDGGGDGGGEGDAPAEAADEGSWKNRNVRLSLVLCVLSGVADSIWGAVVLSGFLYALGKAMGQSKEDNTLVGAAEAAQGLAQLLFALPIGVVADRIGKAKVVRLGAGVVLLAVGVTLWALRAAVRRGDDGSAGDATAAYVVMLVALGLWGVVGGITNGPSQALFADSMRKGKRSEMLTWLYSGYLVSSVVGPVVAIILFLTVSNDEEDWSLEEIYPVFFVGVCLELPVAVVMFFFSDKHVVKEDEEEDASQKESQTAGEEENDVSGNNDDRATQPAVSKGLSRASVPYVLFASSLIMSLASGASVKYFPLFFKELGLTSAEVQVVFAAVPLSIAAFSFISQKMSMRLGRIETTVVLDIVGVSLLFLMTWLSRDEANLDEANKWLIVAVYLLRTGIMNGSYPLLESILMDNVPSNRRARWKSLESIASFGWTGSALAGGILSDRHSYRFTFAITASMQLFGSLMLVPIQPFVESEVASTEQARAPQNAAEGETDLSEPLMEPESNGELEVGV